MSEANEWASIMHKMHVSECDMHGNMHKNEREMHVMHVIEHNNRLKMQNEQPFAL